MTQTGWSRWHTCGISEKSYLRFSHLGAFRFQGTEPRQQPAQKKSDWEQENEANKRRHDQSKARRRGGRGDEGLNISEHVHADQKYHSGQNQNRVRNFS